MVRGKKLLKPGDKVALTVCADGHLERYRERNERLRGVLEGWGLRVAFSDYIYAGETPFSGTARQRAGALLEFYRDPEVKAVFDISGGDLANEILDNLDYEVIRENPKPFFGYSDVSTILNAIYTKTGNRSVLYLLRNLVFKLGDLQQRRFYSSIFEGEDGLFDASYRFLQGTCMEGTVVGGNIRGLLKLAGTEFMPDFNNKVVFLESWHADVRQLAAMIAQLRQLGVFRQVNGVLLGTFTKMEEENLRPTIEEMVLSMCGREGLPVAKTAEIGHNMDAKALEIGSYISLAKELEE